MAKLLRTDGSYETVHPADENQWTKGELTALIGIYNVSRTADNAYLLHPDPGPLFEELDKDEVSFEELHNWKPFNIAVAKLIGYQADCVFGEALLFAEDEVPLTPESLELFGDWGEGKPAVEYVCQGDDCGSIFFYGSHGRIRTPPNFCPVCGAEKPKRFCRKNAHEGISYSPGA